MTTSALLHHGASHLATMEARAARLDGRARVRIGHPDARRRGESRSDADPTAYERANYIGNITSYTSRFVGTGGVPLAGG